jgi:hypothetical protein
MVEVIYKGHVLKMFALDLQDVGIEAHLRCQLGEQVASHGTTTPAQ